ncbi:hypothetical protein V2J09_010645 [Rumex salicifolius]
MVLLNALIAPSLTKGLALLAHSNLPIKIWENAFHTAVYVNNRTITPNLSFKSPYESIYAKQPDYGFLKSFGCMCYPFIRLYNRTKLEYKSLPCIFIGYSPKHKGYCCYHIPSATTYIVRHVIFDEINFPYSTSSSLPHSSEPSPPSPQISAQQSPTTSHTVSSIPPSHPTTDQPPPSPSPPPVEPYPGAPSYYRVVANSEHTMVVAQSSTEAGYRAIAFATTELVWIRELLAEIGVPFTRPPIVLCDNLNATFLSANLVLHQRSKHIELD